MVHAAALGGLKHQLRQAGDEHGRHVAAVCEREVLVLLDLVQHRRHSAAGAASASQDSKERNREEAAAGTDAVA